MTWLLILALVGADGVVTQIESVSLPFATREVCNDAGVEARAFLPVLSPPRNPPWHRIDWICVPTGSNALPEPSLRDRCAERERAKERLREEMRASPPPKEDDRG